MAKPASLETLVTHLANRDRDSVSITAIIIAPGMHLYHVQAFENVGDCFETRCEGFYTYLMDAESAFDDAVKAKKATVTQYRGAAV